ncbi:hypothetical protein Lfu02_80660 [Longispora fulva]|uniref:Uncharacterized protein n=1 Tax=Longispora fulva TaxID=619741 RepID=A0A8J7KMN3_9ACTN|nr:hypothetical protein [Longispora fulva]MBG6140704.1 hypothetical protein [Longispora fulva]MBG6141156.1 hypothetical protein [Longispora fulva]GIG63694.1 hypothetical protein Lfu02_80660 [Longispora fulva]
MYPPMFGPAQPDPLMPASRLFPRALPIVPGNDEQPTDARPFVLRGTVPGIVTAKHRTPATLKKHSNPTSLDGPKAGTKNDEYTTPDD